MTWDIYVILDTVINGVNYCCHPVSYRTVQSFRTGLAWWGERERQCDVKDEVTGPTPNNSLFAHRYVRGHLSCTGDEMHDARSALDLRGIGRENIKLLLDAIAGMVIHCW